MLKNTDYTIIGIDGGGTNTRGVLHRNGKIASEAKAGTTRIGAVGVGESCERTLNVILELCKKAEIETSEIDAVIVGLAGVWLEEEKQRAAQLLKTLARSQDVILNDLIVTSDAEIAVEGAFAGKEGIITIVGTGSIGLARTGKNKLERCGGWGIELDDEGSGAWIGREGLTATVRALDGRGEYTKMIDVVENLYPTITLEEPRTIVKAYAEGAFEYQSLTPSVMKCAVDGDKVCLSIIERSAKHLSELPGALAKHYKKTPIPVALMGGIIEADTLLANLLRDEIAKDDRFKIVTPKGNALEGAISMGMKLIENTLD